MSRCNVRGQIAVNTPSLRGVWTQGNLLHHGLAKTVPEAVLGPGHVGLRAEQRGFAIDASGAFDGHGRTSELSAVEVYALVSYVLSIE